MHLVEGDGVIMTSSEIVVVGGGLSLNILFVRSDTISLTISSYVSSLVFD